MIHPTAGSTYRFEYRRWALRINALEGEEYFWLRRGDIITCLDPTLELSVDSPPEIRFPGDPNGELPLHPKYKRRVRIWLTSSRVVYDTPIGAEHNGREDNLMNFLIELF